jgi:zinc D-Ala-D-Ala carboxypeptidase
VNLTKNFTFEEMTKSETALRFIMGNHPGDTELQNLKILCEEVLQPIRNHYNRGVKVNSGYRHPLVNAKVGGSPRSDHCKGMAADIEIPGIANADLAQFIRDNLNYTKLFWSFTRPVYLILVGFTLVTTPTILRSRS